MQSRKNTSKSENLFEDQKGVEDTSIMNSNGIFYLNYTTNSTMNQHSSFNFEVYFDDMHHLEEEDKKVGKSFVMFPNGFLMTAFDETFGEDYGYHIDDVPGIVDFTIEAFTFRDEIRNVSKMIFKFFYMNRYG